MKLGTEVCKITEVYDMHSDIWKEAHSLPTYIWNLVDSNIWDKVNVAVPDWFEIDN